MCRKEMTNTSPKAKKPGRRKRRRSATSGGAPTDIGRPGLSAVSASGTVTRHKKGEAMTEEQNPSQAAGDKSTNARLAAAAVGGYVLGRTKKGGAALGLASWLGGNQAGQQAMAMARRGLTQVAQSEQVAQILAQIRGPLMEAAQKAATQAVLSRVTAISDGLTARTQALSEVGGTTVKGTAEMIKGTAETVSDTTKRAGGGVKGAIGKLTGKKKGKAEEPRA